MFFRGFTDDIQGTSLDLIINPPDIFTQDPQADQLDPAQEQHGDQGRGLAAKKAGPPVQAQR